MPRAPVPDQRCLGRGWGSAPPVALWVGFSLACRLPPLIRASPPLSALRLSLSIRAPFACCSLPNVESLLLLAVWPQLPSNPQQYSTVHPTATNQPTQTRFIAHQHHHHPLHPICPKRPIRNPIQSIRRQQSINQSDSQSINQTIDQAIKQSHNSINHPDLSFSITVNPQELPRRAGWRRRVTPLGMASEMRTTTLGRRVWAISVSETRLSS